MSDEVFRPGHVYFLWIFIPPNTIGLPSDRDNVRRPVVVYVNDPLPAIGNEFSNDISRPVLMPLPFADCISRIFVPIGTAKKIRPSVAVRIENRNSFCMVGTKT